MTWVVLVVFAVVLRLLWPLIDTLATAPPAGPPQLPGAVELFAPPGPLDPMEPRIEGMVHYLGMTGGALLLESPRGVELAITGDTITVGEALDYLAYVDSLG